MLIDPARNFQLQTKLETGHIHNSRIFCQPTAHASVKFFSCVCVQGDSRIDDRRSNRTGVLLRTVFSRDSRFRKIHTLSTSASSVRQKPSTPKDIILHRIAVGYMNHARGSGELVSDGFFLAGSDASSMCVIVTWDDVILVVRFKKF